jgi:hypothetical protein
MPVMITLNKISAVSLVDSSWKKVFEAHKHLGMDIEFPLSSVLESNDLEDTLWCFEVLPKHIEIPKRFAIWCAREVQHLMTDERSVNAINVAERYLDGNATLEELKAAVRAAAAVARAAYAATATYASSAAVAADTDASSAAAVDRAAATARSTANIAKARQKKINKLREMLDAA